jgi:hypothetical protein
MLKTWNWLFKVSLFKRLFQNSHFKVKNLNFFSMLPFLCLEIQYFESQVFKFTHLTQVILSGFSKPQNIWFKYTNQKNKYMLVHCLLSIINCSNRSFENNIIPFINKGDFLDFPERLTMKFYLYYRNWHFPANYKSCHQSNL